jgi:hypothetical protein
MSVMPTNDPSSATATVVKKAPCHAALIWRQGQGPQRNVPTANREAVRVRKLT